MVANISAELNYSWSYSEKSTRDNKFSLENVKMMHRIKLQIHGAFLCTWQVVSKIVDDKLSYLLHPYHVTVLLNIYVSQRKTLISGFSLSETSDRVNPSHSHQSVITTKTMIILIE